MVLYKQGGKYGGGNARYTNPQHGPPAEVVQAILLNAACDACKYQGESRIGDQQLNEVFTCNRGSRKALNKLRKDEHIDDTPANAEHTRQNAASKARYG